MASCSDEELARVGGRLVAGRTGVRPGAAGPAGAAAPAARGAGRRADDGGRAVRHRPGARGGRQRGGRAERALDDAIKQAVNQTLATLVDAQTRAAQAKTLKAIEAKARSFVPRYRTLEEGEANGVYTIRLEAEVDETALRRRIERGTTTAPPPTTAPAKARAPGMLVAAGDKGEGTAGSCPAW